MDYIPLSPPSSMKQRNKSATVKFHMELLLTHDPEAISQWCDTRPRAFKTFFHAQLS